MKVCGLVIEHLLQPLSCRYCIICNIAIRAMQVLLWMRTTQTLVSLGMCAWFCKQLSVWCCDGCLYTYIE